MDDDADNAQYRIHFHTRQAALQLPSDEVHAVPAKLTRQELSDVVCALLGKRGDDAVALDFLWCDRLVQGSLAQHAAVLGLSREAVAEVEYFAASPEPTHAGAAACGDDWVGALGFARGGVVAGGYDGGLFWAADGAVAATGAHDGAVTAVSAFGGGVATAGKDATVKLWRGAAGEALTPVSTGAHAHAVASLAEASDVLCSGDWGGMVFLWGAPEAGDEPAPKRSRGAAKAAAWAPALTHKAHGQAVTGLAAAPGDRLWSCSWDRGVKVWDATAMEPRFNGTAQVALTCLARPPAEGPDVAATGAHDGAVFVWDARCRPASGVARGFRAHKHQSVSAVRWGGAASSLASCAQDGRVCLWDMRGASTTPVHVLAPPGLSKCLALAAAGDALFVGGDAPQVHRFEGAA